MGQQQLGEVKGRGNAHLQRVVELRPAAIVDAVHLRQGVVDEVVDPRAACGDFGDEGLQHAGVGNIAHVVVAGRKVNYMYLRAVPDKFLGDAAADAMCATRHHCRFVLKAESMHPRFLHKNAFVQDILPEWRFSLLFPENFTIPPLQKLSGCV